MTGKYILYNELRKYLLDQGVKFTLDLATSLSDEFLKHLTYALFPLFESVWKALHGIHNGSGPDPNPEFGVFFGRRSLSHRADKVCMLTTVQHLQELWIGMGKVVTRVNWPDVSLKIKVDPELRAAYL
jgi:hypothetical protein